MKERVLAAAGSILGLVLLGLAVFILAHELQAYRLRDVIEHIESIPSRQLALALALTLAGYLALTGYDALAFHWIGHPLARWRIALASFVAYVFSHNAGVSFFGGSAVRYRMFTSWGVSATELSRVIPFNVITFWLGFLAVGGVVLASEPLVLPVSIQPLFASSQPVGLLALAILGAYCAWTFRGNRALRVRGFELILPGAGTTALQTALSSLDWVLAAAVFFALLPPAEGLSFAHVLGAFLLAQLAGVMSHVPAGLGVFETLMVLLLARWLPGDVVLGSSLAYRAIYYLLPLAVAVPVVVGFELRLRRTVFRRIKGAIAGWVPGLVPRALGIACFAAGVVLLLSGATPAAAGRVALLRPLIPLPLIEASHLLASLIGVALLLLARAIQQRVDAAYGLTLGLLAAGALFSALKGLDWEEATFLASLFAALLPSRSFFYRRSSLLDQSFTPGWILAIGLTLIGTGFVVLLAYRHVEYSSLLWWQFELEAHAPRSLRALVGAAGLTGFFALSRLLRPARPLLSEPSRADVQRALPIALRSARSNACLALLGDKRFLFHESGDGFLMYGVSHRSWVAMGDPIGPAEVRRELAWRFHEVVDQHHGLTAFYEVGADDLPVYLDLGLSLRKLGEEARVRVAGFSLDGSGRKGLRQTLRRMEREGASFEVLGADSVPSVLGDLGAISAAWLESKNTREKRFSLGRFDPAYLSLTPVAVVRRHGRIVAFANLWMPEAREEFSLDLMRYDGNAPAGVMEFLFIQLLFWGQKQGLSWFSLGMAPLAGFESHRLASRWNRVGALLFRYGENFYGFQGLRAFKQKFDPVWEPRYLAAPGGLALPVVLTEIASLIAGGVMGVVTR